MNTPDDIKMHLINNHVNRMNGWRTIFHPPYDLSVADDRQGIVNDLLCLAKPEGIHKLRKHHIAFLKEFYKFDPSLKIPVEFLNLLRGNSMTIKDINQAIMFNDFNNDQLNSIAMAVKYARNQLVKHNKLVFSVGDNVKFMFNGDYKIGIIDSIKIKNVIVRVGEHSKYRIPANLLKAHGE